MQVAKSKYDQLKNTCDDISRLTSSLSNSEIVFFETISISVKFNHPELCFHNVVSWLYILYHEYSAKNIDFIKKKIVSYKIPMTESGAQSKQLVHAFRTIFQHQMDYVNSKLDAEKGTFATLGITRLFKSKNLLIKPSGKSVSINFWILPSK